MIAGAGGLVALRFTSLALTADVTVVVFASAERWLAADVAAGLRGGRDGRSGQVRAAARRPRELLPGLLVAGLIGVPGVATVLVARTGDHLGATVPLIAGRADRDPARRGELLPAGPEQRQRPSPLCSRPGGSVTWPSSAWPCSGWRLGIAGNLIGAFVNTETGAAAPKSGRSGPGGRLVTVRLGMGDSGRRRTGRVAGRRDPLMLGRRLGLACSGWPGGTSSRARLISPVKAAEQARRCATRAAVERLYPATPAGGVAGRYAALLATRSSLSGWNRWLPDRSGSCSSSRSWSILSGMPRSPYLPPSLLGLLVGFSLAQDLSYDGTALWLHISAGHPRCRGPAGRGDVDADGLPAGDVILLAVAMIITGEWHLLAPAVGLTARPDADRARRRLPGRHPLAVAGARRRAPTRSTSATPAGCRRCSPSPSPCAAH